MLDKKDFIFYKTKFNISGGTCDEKPDTSEVCPGGIPKLTHFYNDTTNKNVR